MSNNDTQIKVANKVSQSNDFPASDYQDWVAGLKLQFATKQIKVAVQANTALLEFYWQLGVEIIEKQQSANWGDRFLNQLSLDLKKAFPDVKGFSLRNLKYIRQWVAFYDGKREEKNTHTLIGQQAVAQINTNNSSGYGSKNRTFAQITKIPWGHNLKIISQCDSRQEALFYVHKTIEQGWSRAVLTHQIESGLWKRKGKAVTNFEATLPAVQSDLAKQTLKDPYIFDFLNLTPDFNEHQLEKALVEHVTQFLLELGAGFAYIGKQVPLTVGERDFYIDLLFYHTQLHAYVVIELKVVDFEPEHTGKLNFYIKAVDEQLRTGNDNPTIGILLCKSKDKVVAEYALSDINKPIGVSEYQLTQSLPADLQKKLPSVEQIEAEFAKDLGE